MANYPVTTREEEEEEERDPTRTVEKEGNATVFGGINLNKPPMEKEPTARIDHLPVDHEFYDLEAEIAAGIDDQYLADQDVKEMVKKEVARRADLRSKEVMLELSGEKCKLIQQRMENAKLAQSLSSLEERKAACSLEGEEEEKREESESDFTLSDRDDDSDD